MSSKNKFLFCALISWFVLICQYVLMIQNRVVSMPETTLRFFSFFTILTNVLVAIVFTTCFIKPKNIFNFFVIPSVQTAVAVYIFIVGFVYNVILRFLWKPTGLQQIVDEFLHLVIPIVYILFWFFTVEKSFIKWNSFVLWLLYPLVYISIILVLGSFSNFYPYPFIDVSVLGYSIVLKNALLLTLFFGLVIIVIIYVSKFQTKSKKG